MAVHARHFVRHAVAGAAAFLAAQTLIGAVAGAAPAGEVRSTWFLDSRGGVLAAAAVIAALSALSTVVWRPPHVARACAAFAVGGALAMAVALFAIGPGTIFPIVLVVGAAVMGAAAFAGGLAAAAVTRWLGRSA